MPPPEVGRAARKHTPQIEMVQTMAKTQDSPENIARAIADNHAAAVEFPSMMIPDGAPVGRVAQRMVEGQYDKAFLIGEIERFTGIKADIPERQGRSSLSSRSTATGPLNCRSPTRCFAPPDTTSIT